MYRCPVFVGQAEKRVEAKNLDDISKSDINKVYPYTHIYQPIHEENVKDDAFEMEMFELVKNYDTQIIEV